MKIENKIMKLEVDLVLTNWSSIFYTQRKVPSIFNYQLHLTKDFMIQKIKKVNNLSYLLKRFRLCLLTIFENYSLMFYKTKVCLETKNVFNPFLKFLNMF